MNPPSDPGNQILRRRKKRSSACGPSTSVLTGLHRNGIRVIELVRNSTGYGFTISGQKPCLLRSIIEGSPAALAGLRRGHCLVGVNGKDVSHLAHDEVVHIIGNCTGLVRLHVAESYFSESSDDEIFLSRDAQPRPRHSNNRPRRISKSSLVPAKKFSHSQSPFANETSKGSEFSMNEARSSFDPETAPCREVKQPSGLSSWSVYNSSLPTSKSPVPFRNAEIRHNRNPKRLETVRVFDSLDDLRTAETFDGETKHAYKTSLASNRRNDRFSTYSSSGSSSRGRRNGAAFQKSRRSQASIHQSGFENNPVYQVVVGYVGSMELPEIRDEKRHETLSCCVRVFRKQKKCLKYRSLVLLRIQSAGISVYGSFQNAEKDSPVTFYPANMISFCGAASDDRRFFGLVTCSDTSSVNTSSSCHVFMLEPKLVGHSIHVARAEQFGIRCSRIPMPNSGHVLGLQECDEFPGTADPVLSAILHLHPSSCQEVGVEDQKNSSGRRPPSEASNRHESTTTSSNSDSGIGFRDDSDRLSGKIYDIVDPENVSLEVKRIQHHSPVPKKKLPLSGNRRILSRNALNSSVSPRNAFRFCETSATSDVQPNRPPAPVKKTLPPARLVDHCLPDEEFQAVPNSMKEILQSNRRIGSHLEMEPGSSTVTRSCFQTGLKTTARRGKTNRLPVCRQVSVPDAQPTLPCDVSYRVSQFAPLKETRKRNKELSLNLVQTISRSFDEDSDGRLNSSALYPPMHRTSCTRNGGTRSLDNLCSPEILKEDIHGTGGGGKLLEVKGNIGSSTPALNHNTLDLRKDEWEFKVPEAPKSKSEISQGEKWAESVEKLLSDPTGMEIFTEFLEHEFSAENIHFYTTCLGFKQCFGNLSPSQKISMASTIFQKHLQNGATDPINVDHKARNEVERALQRPTLEMFDLPLAQVYNLLKFDCYPRFLRSDMYRDYLNGVGQTRQSLEERTDSDSESVKSQSKLQSDGSGRRRSLLPWNIKSRSKFKNNNKNSNMFGIQKTTSDQNNGKPDYNDDQDRKSYQLCKVVLPDNSTTILPCKPGEILSSVIQKLLEKREFTYSAFEVISVSSGKAMDPNMEVANISEREIRVEPRAFVEIELPHGWKVGIRANPVRKMTEVLKNILTQHSIKLDNVTLQDLETGKCIDFKLPVGKIDGHSISVLLKGDLKSEVFTNHIEKFYNPENHQFIDDDQISSKTSSSHGSSVFKDFLRRSSKKYKREKPNPSHNTVQAFKTEEKPKQSNESIKKSQSDTILLNSPSKLGSKVIYDDGSSTTSETQVPTPCPFSELSVPNVTNSQQYSVSPLSLIPSELNLVENSRNRNPIYINQPVSKNKS